VIVATDKIRFIESVFGSGRLSARGENIAVHCPECKGVDKDKKKLSIRLDDDLNHCWVCGWSACNLLALLMKHANREDVEKYRRTFLPHANRKKDESSVDAIPMIPRGFKSLYCHFDSNDPDIKSVLRYVINRGITKRDAAYFLLGVSDDYEYRRRVIIPSYDANGRLNFVTTRAINDVVRPRYVNSKNSKSDIVFNELKIDWSKELVIVEGPFDLMKCPENSTCLLGSELNESYLLFSRLLEHNTPVILCLDNDARKKMRSIAQKMMSYDLHVKVCQLPEGSDPGSLSKDQMLDIIGRATTWSREASLIDRIRSI
jgi:hypothetical protein